jgi:hypothetical protein
VATHGIDRHHGPRYPQTAVTTNLAVIRHIALNLIKAEKTSKVGIKIKRLKAGWDNEYLLRVIGAI